MAFVTRYSNLHTKQAFVSISRNFSILKWQKSPNLLYKNSIFNITNNSFRFSSQNQQSKPKRRIGTLGVIALSATAITAAFLFAPIFDEQRRKLLEPFIPEILNYAESSRKVIIQQASLRLLAYLSQKESGALQIEALEGIKKIIQLSTSASEENTKLQASEILLNVSKFESLRQSMWKNGISNWILQNIQQMHSGVFSSSKLLNNIASIALFIIEKDDKSASTLLKAIPFVDMSFMLMNIKENFKLNEILAKSVAKWSRKEKNTSRMLKEQGISFLQVLSASIETAPLEVKSIVFTEIARVIANISMNTEQSYQFVRESGLEFLYYMRNMQPNWDPLTEQIVRSIANIAANENNSFSLLEKGWIKYISETLTSNNKDIKLGCFVAIANASVNEAASIYFVKDDYIMDLLKSTGSKEDEQELKEQVARILANLSSHNQLEIGHEIFHRIGTDTLIKLANSQDIVVKRHIARTFSNFSNQEEIAFHFITASNGLWKSILQLAEIEDVEIDRSLAKSVANLAVNVGTGLQTMPEVTRTLDNWTHSEDMIVRNEAIRARSSLASIALKGPKYAEGIYLLYPQNNHPVEFDVVFIHGVSGDAFGTWKGLDKNSIPKPQEPSSTEKDDFLWEIEIPGFIGRESSNETTSVVSDRDLTVWPRDWLPKKFPKARVISVGYDLYLSKWTADTLPLEQLSMEVLKKLKLAALGTRPIIFVSHSFGGLITKQMLLYASRNDSYKSILDKTTGIVFFATPHRGSEVADYVDILGGAVAKVFRPNTVITELRPQSETLNYLNSQFPIIAPKVATLSFGENDRTCFGSQYTCLQIVSDYSANPNFGGSNHHFQKLDLSHRMVCKLESEEDMQYKLVVEFIQKSLKSFASSKQ